MIKSQNLNSTSFGTKALAVGALAATGWYLHSQNSEKLKERESGAPDWTLFKSPLLLFILVIVALVVFAYVWHVVSLTISPDLKNQLNLLMGSILVLLFASVISYTSGSLKVSRYTLIIATALGIAASLYLWKTHYKEAVLLALLSAFLAYRVAALYSLPLEVAGEAV